MMKPEASCTGRAVLAKVVFEFLVAFFCGSVSPVLIFNWVECTGYYILPLVGQALFTNPKAGARIWLICPAARDDQSCEPFSTCRRPCLPRAHLRPIARLAGDRPDTDGYSDTSALPPQTLHIPRGAPVPERCPLHIGPCGAGAPSLFVGWPGVHLSPCQCSETQRAGTSTATGPSTCRCALQARRRERSRRLLKTVDSS